MARRSLLALLLSAIALLAMYAAVQGGHLPTSGTLALPPVTPTAHDHADHEHLDVLAERHATAQPTASATLQPTASPSAPTATTAPSPEPTATRIRWEEWPERTEDGRVIVRWLAPDDHSCGAGRVDRFAEEFNDAQDKIYLEVHMLYDLEGQDMLETMVAGGAPIDIVGPLGFNKLSRYQEHWRPLDDLLASHEVDLSVYDPAPLAAYRDAEGQLYALPYAVFPSLIYFNKDLFDAAGLAYPPQRFGELYEGQPWDMAALRALGMRLTLDERGKNATEPEFDATKIVQFGFVPQWNDSAISEGAFFGAGDLTGADHEATIPQAWQEAWKWFYNARHVDHFVPNSAYANSDEFGQGNVWSTGKAAMAWTHLWYTCCFTPEQVPSWDLAVVPSYEGTTTAKLHADTFGMTKRSRNPDAAFAVYQHFLKDPEMRKFYGGFPPMTAEQPAYFATLDEQFKPNQVNWQVALDSLAYLDIPSHEQDVPNYPTFQDRYVAFDQLRHADPKLDIGAEIARLEADLTAIFRGEE